jgi:endonuclease YncB( thermonuclease family)
MKPPLRLPRARGPAAVLLALIGLGGGGAWLESSGWLYVWFPGLLPPPLTSGEPVRLLKVRDGDTVEVRYGDLALAVRLRGVDTAESVHADASRNTDAGRESSAWAKSYLAGKAVRIEFERRHGLIDLDRHDRALGWMWIEAGPPGPAGDELFNATLVAEGHSRYETTFGISPRYHQAMLAAEAASAKRVR